MLLSLSLSLFVSLRLGVLKRSGGASQRNDDDDDDDEEEGKKSRLGEERKREFFFFRAGALLLSQLFLLLPLCIWAPRKRATRIYICVYARGMGLEPVAKKL